MYSNFKSYHHLLIDSGASTHVCPKDYAPDLPLRPCGEPVPQLYTVTNKKIPVYGIKYVPYKQDNFRIMIPYYVCDVKYPILSASRLLDRGYGLDFTPRHCTITHGQQQAHLIRHSGLFYLRAEKIDIPTGFDIYPMTTDSGKSIAVIQPTERAAQQQEQIAPLTHTDQGLRQILGGNTDYWKLDGDYAIRVHERPRKALLTPHNSGCPIPEEELDDWRLTIRRKTTPTRRATSKTTPTRQSSQPQRLMDTPPTRSKIQLRAPQKIWRPKAAPSTNLDTTQPKETIHPPLTAQEDNQDYWERQGEHWIRHHTLLRTTLFTPTDGPGHPPISTLEPHRTTITHNNFGEVSQRKDDWTVMGNAALPFQWKGTTRFTVKKDYEYIQENHDEEQQHEHHEAHRAIGLRQPQQPTPQQIAEHNVTHLPYRNWCPICVQGKGRQDNYKKQQSRQPIIQVDFAYIKSQQDPKTIPVLTAVDVTTQLCMAVLVPDKPSMMDYMINNLQAFIFERGRTHGILQSDNEDTLNALLQATASKVGSMTVRHSPSYSSNSQGSVERLHRTLLGQIRVVKAQVESNYSMTMSTKHCLLSWIVRHAAWTVNRYVIHSDGYTSFERRWGRKPCMDYAVHQKHGRTTWLKCYKSSAL